MTLELVVADKEKPADGVVRLTLRAPGGDPLPPWEPGAHIDLVLPGFVRQYSLCGDPSDTVETVTVVRDSDDTLPLAVASAALVVAMAAAGVTVVRRAPRRAAS